MSFSFPHNSAIVQEIKSLLGEANHLWPAIGDTDDYFLRLSDYSIRGKMIRSNLVVMSWLGYQDSSAIPSKTALQVAAVQELTESALLVQDDVMDDDLLRRGMPSLHCQYQELARQIPAVSLRQSEKFGEAWAVTLGDMLFFLVFEVLAKLEISAETRLQLVSLYSSELLVTGSGQLADLAAGFGVFSPSFEQVAEINRQKTAHYTICLPLLAGATLAQQPKEELVLLNDLGETVGEIFQLTDDRLDLFSNSDISGKSQASDVKSGKKTALYFFTKQKLSEDPKLLSRFLELYGKSDCGAAEIIEVQTIVKKSGAYQQSEELLGELAERARQQIANLHMTQDVKKQLHALLEYLLIRER